ncbi:PLP-dependent transferase [Streptomyces sp. NPDC004980]
MTDATRLVWGESISIPTLRVADIPAFAEVAHRGRCAARGRLDVRHAGGAPALPRGADLVVHSATKYFGGQSDAAGGASWATIVIWSRCVSFVRSRAEYRRPLLGEDRYHAAQRQCLLPGFSVRVHLM